MRRLAASFGIAAGLIAGFCLTGWALAEPWMRNIVPGHSEMKFNTGVALLTSAVALVLAARRHRPRAPRLLGGLVLAIASATLVEYVAGVQLGIDELIVADTAAVFTSDPGRMAPNTAVCLALCGGALVSFRPGTRMTTVATWAALVAAAIALVALVGVIAAVPSYLTVGGLTRISLPTATALLLVGTGIALASPERGALTLLARDGPGGDVARRLIPLVVVVTPLLGFLRWQGQAAGLYDTQVGILLLVASMIAVSIVAVVFSARALDRVEAQRLASEIELRLQSQITAELGEGVCVVRWSDSTIVYANARFEEMLGAATGTLAGAASDTIEIVAADRQMLVTACRATLRSAGHWTGEVEYVRADSSRFWADVTISAFEHPEHGPLSVSVLTDVSERHAAAAALARQMELFDSVLRAAADHSIIGTGVDGTIAVFNAGAERMLGYGAAEMIGRQTPAVFHDAREVAARAAQLGLEPGFEVFVHAARGGEIETREWTYVRKDGGRIDVSLTVTAMHDEDGELCGFIGIAQDITERKAAQTRLHEQQRLLAESQAVGRIGSWEWNLETGEPRWSDEQFRLHGLDPAAGVPPLEEYFELLRDEDRAALRASMAAHLERRAEFTDEYRIELADGSLRTLLVHGDYLAPADGRPARLAGTTQDVTAERAARAAQRAAEEEFRRAFDDALIGMMIVDLDGRFMRVNDAFCAIVGHDRETLIGLSREGITHPDDLAADTAAVRGLLAGETTSYARQKRYIHRSGHAVWVSVGVTLIQDADGRPLHFIGQAQDITERRRYERQLEHMADHDPLTGLLNRRSFERELTSHVARVKRFGTTGAVLMIDLDNFKYFNDTQGHNAGDELIVRVAQGLRSRLRETDVVARLGGDEFAVLLPQADRDGAEAVATALLEHVRDGALATAVDDRRRLTASIGIACFEDAPQMSGEDMMINADLAMYEAKEHGRNRLACYRTDQHSRPRVESHMKWAIEIEDALTDDRFELLAQPITPLRGDGPARFELLVRMRDSRGELIPPSTFLYIAERLGLIGEIDRWVVGHAIDLLAEHGAAGRDLRFEVNLSGHTIGDEELLTFIERRLDETGVAPDRLIFEITETAAIANVARAASFAERLGELGCKFALDDFGAGFGSFYYLKHLPFDYLKIDGEYVLHCATSETDRILIAAVVQIARAMGKRTIAEFVGDQETIEVLTRLGVDLGQGFFLGRPQPLDDHLAAMGLLGGVPASQRDR